MLLLQFRRSFDELLALAVGGGDIPLTLDPQTTCTNLSKTMHFTLSGHEHVSSSA